VGALKEQLRRTQLVAGQLEKGLRVSAGASLRADACRSGGSFGLWSFTQGAGD
jgi:hypothetical protein